MPAPAAYFGFLPGRDGQLANWASICAYMRALAAASPHVRLLYLGGSGEGRPLIALAIASPHLLQQLDAIATDQQALAVAPRGKRRGKAARQASPAVAIVVQTCGVHAAEAAAPQAAAELAAELASRTDATACRIRERLIFLLVPAVDPDGLDRMHAWTEWGRGRVLPGSTPPGLYRAYAGHDINRDWIMQTQPEIRAVVEGIHARFLPHVVLDMHEMWTHGPRLFVPPYAAPADPAVNPTVIARAGALGAEVAARLTAAGLPGVATGTVFDAFSPARGYVHYHGGVRILCEAAGAGLAAALTIAAAALRPMGGFDPRLASPRQPLPWSGGSWSSADVIHYQHAATWAALETVARDAEDWRAWQREVLAAATDTARRPGGYVLPAEQADPTAAGELLRALRAGGLRTQIGPGGATVLPRAQPFGAWADALLCPQAYPSARGSPATPYDVTAHLLPALMGVQCTFVDGEPASATPPAVTAPPNPRFRGKGLRLWPANDSASYRQAFATLAAGQRVWQIDPAPEPEALTGGGGFVAGTEADIPEAWRAAARPLTAPCVAVYAAWKSDSDEGWLRYLLDRFKQPFALVRDSDIQRGELGGCTHLILPSLRGRDLMHGLPADRYPPAYAGGLGERGRRQIRDFTARGGRLLAVEWSAAWAQAALDLPVEDRTVQPNTAVFVPGAILPVAAQPGPWGFGFGPRSHVMYRGGPAFVCPPAQMAATFTAAPAAAGLAQGIAVLAGTAAVADIPYHGGRCVLYGFSPYFRGQTWGAFRWLFNALFI